MFRDYKKALAIFLLIQQILIKIDFVGKQTSTVKKNGLNLNKEKNLF